ncbi:MULTISPECIES: HEAT repeat domain-containing protein [Methanobacterium]|uniref:HEAT repeat domain-containing protein n=1 Tax=Methanobacterium veterum TaxID=408577 RepID=A0A9E5A711_9EURY|nr:MULTISPECIES: HEAT repeat domain-containing protein [Methanobacterium]MCZ3366615.1 hypothetical protein [Methanobacterium veterum]MCZ3374241.1 hypothetical protein [Methanobacterium veterum]
MGHENKTGELIGLLENEKWQTRYKALSSLIKQDDNSALEIVKKMLNEDENAHVREIAVEYLKFNNSFPLKPINPENVNLYHFPIKNSHTKLGIINATSDPTLSENEAIENIKYKLKQEAAQLGANAVININCRKKFLLLKQFKAKGYAVLINDAPEKIHVEKSNKVILLGILYIIWGLSYFLFNGTFNLFSIFILGGGLIIFTAGIFKIKQYQKDKLYLTIMASIIIVMLILTYIQMSPYIDWWL